MKRVSIDLERVASQENLLRALHRAALGKRQRHEVKVFFQDVWKQIERLRQGILEGWLPHGDFFRFQILDPKSRTIHAPSFQDRVIHHALMHHCGAVLDRVLVPTTYACRSGKGTSAAVLRAQLNSRRWPWFVKMDVRRYFDSIDQGTMLRLLQRKFKGIWVLTLFNRILESYQTLPGKGLPIGALTSQYFANFYLDGWDRYLTESLGVAAHIRYMDDVLCWCRDPSQARRILAGTRTWLAKHRNLDLKANTQIHRSALGMTFLGYRITPARCGLSQRRKRRYRKALNHWEASFRLGDITPLQLQQGYAGVHSVVAHAQCRTWRRNLLRDREVLEV